MHHALQIHEILSNVFEYCRDTPDTTWVSELASLARTCRAFKEPALDALWEELHDLSPLARCLPEVSHQSSPDRYSFSRSLTKTEWDILRSYTRRIRSIRDFDRGLDWESVPAILNPSSTAPLFPNLRYVHRSICTEKSMPLLHLPLPSLRMLSVTFKDPHIFQNSLDSFLKLSANLRTLHMHAEDHADTFYHLRPNYICRWENLCSLTCSRITLDMDDLKHLSSMPALTLLRCAFCATLPVSESRLVFSNLRCLSLHSESLNSILQLFFRTRLPAITSFGAVIDSRPSAQDITSFLTGVATSDVSHTIEELILKQPYLFRDFPPSDGLLDFEDLQPCMKFNSLRHIEVDIEVVVQLTDTELLTLTSAWPKLEHFLMNANWGWYSECTITPDGLVRLLQTCQSLSKVAVAIDTRGYVEVPPSHAPARLGLTLPPHFLMDVVDTVVDVESVPAVTSFFCGIKACSGANFSFHAWTGWPMMNFPNEEEQMKRWKDIHSRITAALCRSSEPGGRNLQVAVPLDPGTG